MDNLLLITLTGDKQMTTYNKLILTKTELSEAYEALRDSVELPSNLHFLELIANEQLRLEVTYHHFDNKFLFERFKVNYILTKYFKSIVIALAIVYIVSKKEFPIDTKVVIKNTLIGSRSNYFIKKDYVGFFNLVTKMDFTPDLVKSSLDVLI